MSICSRRMTCTLEEYRTILERTIIPYTFVRASRFRFPGKLDWNIYLNVNNVVALRLTNGLGCVLYSLF